MQLQTTNHLVYFVHPGCHVILGLAADGASDQYWQPTEVANSSMKSLQENITRIPHM